MEIACMNLLTEAGLREVNVHPSAQYLLMDAQHRANARALYGRISPLAVLWSMLRWERKAPIVAIERCGVDLTELMKIVDEILGECNISVFGPTQDFAALWELVQAARQEADRRGEEQVCAHHLLLALLGSGAHDVIRVMNAARVSLEQIEAQWNLLISGR
jgi:ATP-dependent Clp protease ATP-binding subunit ClpA